MDSAPVLLHSWKGDGKSPKRVRRQTMVVVRVLVFALLLTLLGCGKSPTDSVALLGGNTKVEVFRIDGEKGPGIEEPGETRLDGYLVLSRGKDLAPELTVELADVLANKEIYTAPQMKCGFDPGIAFRSRKDSETVDVLICFRCDELYVGRPVRIATANGNFFFDPPIRARLVKLAKKAFPEVKEIQALTDERPSHRPKP